MDEDDLRAPLRPPPPSWSSIAHAVSAALSNDVDYQRRNAAYERDCLAAAAAAFVPPPAASSVVSAAIVHRPAAADDADGPLEPCPPPPGTTSPPEDYVEPLLPATLQPRALAAATSNCCTRVMDRNPGCLALEFVYLVFFGGALYLAVVLPIGLVTKRGELFYLLIPHVAVVMVILWVIFRIWWDWCLSGYWPSGQRCDIRCRRFCATCEI
jgi:hypothetical protein